MMGTVRLSEETIQQLQEIAAQREESLEVLTERALKQFLRKATQHALHREVKAFKAQHATLFEQYAGRYIAMYQGEVVDEDEDQLALLERVNDAYPNTPVLITPVLTEPEETYTVHSHRNKARRPSGPCTGEFSTPDDLDVDKQVQISLPATLVEELSHAASTQHTNLTAILIRAIEHYLKEKAHQAIEQEQRAYTAQHPQIVTQYAGEYIAMHDGEVVDHDADRAALGRRVRAHYDRTPVLITPVLAQPQQVITVRSPRLKERYP